MEDIYKAEKIGRNWCITKNGELLRTIGAGIVSESRASEQAVELNEAFQEGKLAGEKSGLNCPFCKEQGDFDAIGLKYHLEVYCTEFQNTKQL